jgi:hypothetical protein
MNPRHCDIIRKDHDKLALWLEAAPDLRAAESRVAELTSFWPGEFQIIPSTKSSDSREEHWPFRPQLGHCSRL